MLDHSVPPVTADRSRRGHDPYDDIDPWLEKLAAIPADDAEYARVREHIVHRCLPLAEHIARRYAGRGELYDDLYQVASVGLVLAIDRYELGKGSSFMAFAVPTMMGEVRRHFRDRTWALRVPRSTKLLQAAIGPAVERLSHRLHRMPTASELATELEVDRVEITHALLASNAYSTDSIDGSDSDDSPRLPTPPALVDADSETGYRLTDDALAIGPLLLDLPERDRRVLRLRFFENRTQVQIAEQLGVSQMQVSRILTKALTTLRERALQE
ncbi:SigB/SigF/SigG family RNA polymerase sigma factor [Nocardia sp. alder85J]|uniref:SigB/SigF/SigG family RNA polymerase sigma factor n=1 Tax=Nocardia sp. alder85J TaxID=2862949 RepID=UPI001CD75FCE|nr:SigB/SigF/SigG family RNA polymerase sigma factor [Nocardia sp. alder85J]MCX4092986.1 SigB/SigF/SigG family RNA polymerase sigma factor [Nocardia sp. alder85J]